uniref:Uncharacterized protein n=1 Tax=viral metagenome TaxID=1070528 RepID=A0A6M3L9U9_9ZZZZ
MIYKPHNHPEKDGWSKAERCPYCKRWMVVDFQTEDTRPDHKGEVHTYYSELNFDKDGGFYYSSCRSHSLLKCRLNKKIRIRRK